MQPCFLASRSCRYFFGCGKAHRACLADWATLSGPVPLPPREAIGVWWSHYEPYSAVTIQRDVLAAFRNFSLAIDVLQLDVNWHTNNPTGDARCHGYNGHTDRTLGSQ
jgi:alpha-glucosidase (family GH31 glycosyl hydrolase)